MKLKTYLLIENIHAPLKFIFLLNNYLSKQCDALSSLSLKNKRDVLDKQYFKLRLNLFYLHKNRYIMRL